MTIVVILEGHEYCGECNKHAEFIIIIITNGSYHLMNHWMLRVCVCVAEVKNYAEKKKGDDLAWAIFVKEKKVS